MRGGERPALCRGDSGEGSGRDDDSDLHRQLERHGLAHQLFGISGITWPSGGGLLKKGSIVDATIISAPSSTKNNARDPEMHRTRKGCQWHFGMKLHIGTDPRGLVHHLEGTAANAHDLTPSDRLLHGEEEQVRADAGYRGIGKRTAHAHREVSWQIAMPPSKRRTLAPDSAAAKAETAKARARARVEIRSGSSSGCSAATWFAIGVWRGTCSDLRCFWASRT